MGKGSLEGVETWKLFRVVKSGVHLRLARERFRAWVRKIGSTVGPVDP